MKKQQGFTLIELMVVMAIIAILATAGLSAYTGYIKKARDTKRISDIATINTIVLANIASTGIPPSEDDIVGIVTTTNNGKPIEDPVVGKESCLGASNSSEFCTYMYYTCDGGTGYALTASFESTSNTTSLYTNNASGSIVDTTNAVYDIGNCHTSLDASGGTELYTDPNGPE